MIPNTKVSRARAESNLGPLLRFRLYPEGRKEYWFQVVIHRTDKSVQIRRRELERNLGPYPKGGVYAFVVPSSSKHSRCLGELHLSHWCASDRTVAHELLHCAILWADAVDLPITYRAMWQSGFHERLAEAFDSMVDGFWKQYSKKHPRSQCWGFGRK